MRYEEQILFVRGAPDKRIWPGMLNGLGGHVEQGEDPLTAMQREVREECGLDIPKADFWLRLIVSIDAGIPGTGILNFVFVAQSSSRELTPSSEGTLEWHRFDELDDLPCVEDVPWLVKKVFTASAGTYFAHYSYDDAGKLVITESTP